MGKLLPLLLLIQIKNIWCFRFEIVRGARDQYMLPGDKLCGDSICTCPDNEYRTFVYNSSSNKRCVRDEDIITDRSEGYMLRTDNNKKCLGVSAHGDVTNSSCYLPENGPLSIHWLWTNDAHLLNLKTLKCLEVTSSAKKELMLKRCVTLQNSQRWQLSDSGGSYVMRNDAEQGYSKAWFGESTPYLTISTPRSSYKGCYRYSGGQFMHLVEKSGDGRKSLNDKSCSFDLDILAPIYYNNKTDCNVRWKESLLSIDGSNWTKLQLDPRDIENFHLETNSSERTTLKILNSTLLIQKWPARLLKVAIECNQRKEAHCVLLKISGSFKNGSSSTSFTLPLISNNSEKPTSSFKTSVPNPSSKSKLFIIPIVILILVIAGVIAFVVFYRRRKRSACKQDNHFNEGVCAESNPSNATQCNAAQLSEAHFDGYAETNVYSTPDYACPVNNTAQQNSQENPSNTQGLAYDYATREETPLIPHILSGEIILDPPSIAQREKSDPQGTISNHDDVDNNGHANESDERPVYHTLENNEVKAENSDKVDGRTETNYNVPEAESNTEHVYNVLEATSG